MVKYSLIFLLFLLGNLSPASGQTDWRAIVAPAFEALDKEVVDSISACRLDADKLREEMDKIIERKGLERYMIVGKNDEYFKEGMHKNFKKPPVKMQVEIDRDKEIVRLEALHSRLCQRDATLYDWLATQTKLNKHPDRTNYPKWSARHQNLPVDQRPDLQSAKACQQWVKDELVCEIANARQAFSPVAAGNKLNSFDVELKALKIKPGEYPTRQTLPVPQEEVLCSFPANGQFAFHPSETIPKVGYVLLPLGCNGPLGEIVFSGYEFKARWTASNGETQYTAADYQAMQGTFYFNVPNQLDGGQIYRLQLVALPDSYRTAQLPVKTCWDIFRGKSTLPYQQENAYVEGEKLITELYFRAGLYSVPEKLETMRGDINWERGEIIFETDEPLDPFEMYGSSVVPPTVRFTVQTAAFFNISNAINSSEVLYYLTVPRVEPFENIPKHEYLIAELDNTLDAPFIRKTGLGNAKGYRKLPEYIATDTPLPGNYIAPSYLLNNVQDSLATQYQIPFISKSHFDKKQRYELMPTRCTLMVGELKQLINATTSLQRQLKKRMEERVNFFFELEKRRAIREGTALAISKEQLMQIELENLPKDVKTLLDAKIPDSFLPKFSLIYFRYFPGTNRLNTELQLKF